MNRYQPFSVGDNGLTRCKGSPEPFLAVFTPFPVHDCGLTVEKLKSAPRAFTGRFNSIYRFLPAAWRYSSNSALVPAVILYYGKYGLIPINLANAPGYSVLWQLQIILIFLINLEIIDKIAIIEKREGRKNFPPFS